MERIDPTSTAQTAVEVESEVSVRFRPLAVERIAEGSRSACFVSGPKSVGIDTEKTRLSRSDPAVQNTLDELKRDANCFLDSSSSLAEFPFNGSIFDEGTATARVYKKIVQPLVIQVTEGISSTVIACGGKGSGKTFTLFGTHDHPGVIFNALQDLFNHIASYRHPASPRTKPQTNAPQFLAWNLEPHKWLDQEYEFSVRCSYVEIREHAVADLLHCAADFVPTDILPTLALRRTPKGMPFIEGVTEKPGTSVEDLVRELARAAALKKARDKLFPERPSSGVVTITVEKARIGRETQLSSERSSPPRHRSDRNVSEDSLSSFSDSPNPQEFPVQIPQITRATLTFVETQGTEGLALPDRGAFENQSLFVMAEDLLSLTNSNSGKAASSAWAGSTLTQILYPAVHGDSNLSMIITIDPADSCLAVSLPTLRFGSRISGGRRRLRVTQISRGNSHLRALHLTLSRHFRHIQSVWRKRKDEEEGLQLLRQLDLEQTRARGTDQSWWLPSSAEARDTLSQLEEDLTATRRQILVGGTADWSVLEGSRLSNVLSIVSVFQDRRFVRETLGEDTSRRRPDLTLPDSRSERRDLTWNEPGSPESARLDGLNLVADVLGELRVMKASPNPHLTDLFPTSTTLFLSPASRRLPPPSPYRAAAPVGAFLCPASAPVIHSPSYLDSPTVAALPRNFPSPASPSGTSAHVSSSRAGVSGVVVSSPSNRTRLVNITQRQRSMQGLFPPTSPAISPAGFLEASPAWSGSPYRRDCGPLKIAPSQASQESLRRMPSAFFPSIVQPASDPIISSFPLRSGGRSCTPRDACCPERTDPGFWCSASCQPQSHSSPSAPENAPFTFRAVVTGPVAPLANLFAQAEPDRKTPCTNFGERRLFVGALTLSRASQSNAPRDDVGRAMEDLERSLAELRNSFVDREELPCLQPQTGAEQSLRVDTVLLSPRSPDSKWPSLPEDASGALGGQEQEAVTVAAAAAGSPRDCRERGHATAEGEKQFCVVATHASGRSRDVHEATVSSGSQSRDASEAEGDFGGELERKASTHEAHTTSSFESFLESLTHLPEPSASTPEEKEASWERQAREGPGAETNGSQDLLDTASRLQDEIIDLLENPCGGPSHAYGEDLERGEARTLSESLSGSRVFALTSSVPLSPRAAPASPSEPSALAHRFRDADPSEEELGTDRQSHRDSAVPSPSRIRVRLSVEGEEEHQHMSSRRESPLSLQSRRASQTTFIGTPSQLLFSLAREETDKPRGSALRGTEPGHAGLPYRPRRYSSSFSSSSSSSSSSPREFGETSPKGHLSCHRRQRGGESWVVSSSQKDVETDSGFCLPEPRAEDRRGDTKQSLYFQGTLRPWTHFSTPGIVVPRTEKTPEERLAAQRERLSGRRRGDDSRGQGGKKHRTSSRERRRGQRSSSGSSERRKEQRERRDRSAERTRHTEVDEVKLLQEKLVELQRQLQQKVDRINSLSSSSCERRPPVSFVIPAFGSSDPPTADEDLYPTDSLSQPSAAPSVTTAASSPPPPTAPASVAPNAFACAVQSSPTGLQVPAQPVPVSSFSFPASALQRNFSPLSFIQSVSGAAPVVGLASPPVHVFQGASGQVLSASSCLSPVVLTPSTFGVAAAPSAVVAVNSAVPVSPPLAEKVPASEPARCSRCDGTLSERSSLSSGEDAGPTSSDEFQKTDTACSHDSSFSFCAEKNSTEQRQNASSDQGPSQTGNRATPTTPAGLEPTAPVASEGGDTADLKSEGILSGFGAPDRGARLGVSTSPESRCLQQSPRFPSPLETQDGGAASEAVHASAAPPQIQSGFHGLYDQKTPGERRVSVNSDNERCGGYTRFVNSEHGVYAPSYRGSAAPVGLTVTTTSATPGSAYSTSSSFPRYASPAAASRPLRASSGAPAEGMQSEMPRVVCTIIRDSQGLPLDLIPGDGDALKESSRVVYPFSPDSRGALPGDVTGHPLPSSIFASHRRPEPAASMPPLPASPLQGSPHFSRLSASSGAQLPTPESPSVSARRRGLRCPYTSEAREDYRDFEIRQGWRQSRDPVDADHFYAGLGGPICLEARERSPQKDRGRPAARSASRGGIFADGLFGFFERKVRDFWDTRPGATSVPPRRHSRKEVLAARPADDGGSKKFWPNWYHVLPPPNHVAFKRRGSIGDSRRRSSSGAPTSPRTRFARDRSLSVPRGFPKWKCGQDGPVQSVVLLDDTPNEKTEAPSRKTEEPRRKTGGEVGASEEEPTQPSLSEEEKSAKTLAEKKTASKEVTNKGSATCPVKGMAKDSNKSDSLESKPSPATVPSPTVLAFAHATPVVFSPQVVAQGLPGAPGVTPPLIFDPLWPSPSLAPAPCLLTHSALPLVGQQAIPPVTSPSPAWTGPGTSGEANASAAPESCSVPEGCASFARSFGDICRQLLGRQTEERKQGAAATPMQSLLPKFPFFMDFKRPPPGAKPCKKARGLWRKTRILQFKGDYRGCIARQIGPVAWIFNAFAGSKG
ncbi:UNVERIFIED_CONTAM: kinesin motor domain-containing protein [Hammondia hammondi]|eukprot:XP_008887662.1 kinesin motor domain-containing protein [Hammondia hammondi]